MRIQFVTRYDDARARISDLYFGEVQLDHEHVAKTKPHLNHHSRASSSNRLLTGGSIGRSPSRARIMRLEVEFRRSAACVLPQCWRSLVPCQVSRTNA